MIGIYKITNKINGKIYIGQSKDIAHRWKEHKWRSKNCLYPIQKAITKYGIENFEFEVIEECLLEELDDREIYYIDLYNSTNKAIGYNISKGGDTGPIMYGENNPNCVVSDIIVSEIRSLYFNGYNKKEAYAEILKIQQININTFADIWIGKTHKQIDYYVYDDEYKGEILELRKLNKSKNTITAAKQYVQDIRNSKASGIPISTCYKQYKDKIGKFTFDDIWYYRVYPYIMPTVEDKYIPFKRAPKQNPAVDQYDLDGNFIKTFNCLEDAIIELKGKFDKNVSTRIRNVCKGVAKSACGYIWKFNNCND